MVSSGRETNKIDNLIQDDGFASGMLKVLQKPYQGHLIQIIKDGFQAIMKKFYKIFWKKGISGG